MRTNGSVCCGDCEHYCDDGCEEAAEALALEGWPRASVCPDDSADASRCPEFRPSEDYALALDEERAAAAAHARMTALRGLDAW